MRKHPEESLQESEREGLPSGTEDAQAEGGEAPTVEEVTAEATLEQTLRREVEEWRDKFLRKAAELENYRKRTRQDIENITTAVRQGLVLDFLEIIDDFDRFLSNSQQHDAENLRDGARLIGDKISRVLASLGIERIEAEGKPFCHDEHEAVLTMESTEHAPNTVVSVVQPGYKMNGKVIRYAQVVVSKKPESKSDPDEPTEDTG
ncbi:MAG: nucleotide exchange factor GrpE [Calditrichaeota bacterium]|nr:nucleotide exchange factor GrpE [Calditrichota bacterium]